MSLAFGMFGYMGTKRAFDVGFSQVDMIQGVQEFHNFPAIKCNFTRWKELYGSAVYNEAFLLGENALCAPPDFNMSIVGRYTTNNSRLIVTAVRCYEPDCLTDS
jgi:hypothetical protein